MGLFFSRSVAPAAKQALRDAYISHALEEQEAEQHARHIVLQFPNYGRALTDAYMAAPVPHQRADRQAEQVGNELAKRSAVPTVQKFHWLAFSGSVALLVLIFAAGAYSQHDDKMKEWSGPLLNAFQVLLGGWVGILVGEKDS